jgi:hypothetical protein
VVDSSSRAGIALKLLGAGSLEPEFSESSDE